MRTADYTKTTTMDAELNLPDRDEKPVLVEDEQCLCDDANSCEKCDDSGEMHHDGDLHLSLSIPLSTFKKKPRSIDGHKTVECTQCNRKMRSDHLKRHLQRRDHSVVNAESKKLKFDEEFQFSSYITGYYHYRHRWTPQIEEELPCVHEADNIYDE